MGTVTVSPVRWEVLAPSGLLHQIGFGGGGGSGGDVEFDFGRLAGPLVHAEDEGVGVFGFFDGGEGDVVGCRC